jgi:FtsH-binding integral membrane protein
VVLALSFLAQRISGPIAALLFMVYAGLTGLTLSWNLLRLLAGLDLDCVLRHRGARSPR